MDFMIKIIAAADRPNRRIEISAPVNVTAALASWKKDPGRSRGPVRVFPPGNAANPLRNALRKVKKEAAREG